MLKAAVETELPIHKLLQARAPITVDEIIVNKTTNLATPAGAQPLNRPGLSAAVLEEKIVDTDAYAIVRRCHPAVTTRQVCQVAGTCDGFTASLCDIPKHLVADFKIAITRVREPDELKHTLHISIFEEQVEYRVRPLLFGQPKDEAPAQEYRGVPGNLRESTGDLMMLEGIE